MNRTTLWSNNHYPDLLYSTSVVLCCTANQNRPNLLYSKSVPGAASNCFVVSKISCWHAVQQISIAPGTDLVYSKLGAASNWFAVQKISCWHAVKQIRLISPWSCENQALARPHQNISAVFRCCHDVQQISVVEFGLQQVVQRLLLVV